MINFKKSVASLALGLTVFSAHAYTTLTNPGTCTTDSFSITAVKPSVLPGDPIPLATPINSTSCYGVISEVNNDNKVPAPTYNLGYLGDGLLNGGTFTQQVKVEGQKGTTAVETQLVSPTQFISLNQLLGLQDPNNLVDPGWILLGSKEGTGSLTITDKPVSTLNELISINVNSNGTWSMNIAADIAAQLAAAGLTTRSYFDHLAFVVKAGSGESDGGWAIYDFDFNQIAGFDLTKAYSFGGVWNMGDFGGKNLSHISVWARDPITSQNVPAPGTVLLLGIGLVALYGARKKMAA